MQVNLGSDAGVMIIDAEGAQAKRRIEHDARRNFGGCDLGNAEDAAGHFVRDGHKILRLDARAGDEAALIGLHLGDGNARRILNPGGAAGEKHGRRRHGGESENAKGVFHGAGGGRK